MIGKDQIAEAARYADAGAEEHGLQTYLRGHDIDHEGLMYVANQRALRAVMIERGQSPNVTRPTPVNLTREELNRMVTYAALFMDGFVVGVSIEQNGVGI
jgi:hypothetical protein